MSTVLDEVRVAGDARTKVRLGEQQWMHATERLRALLRLPEHIMVDVDERAWRLGAGEISICGDDWKRFEGKLLARYPEHGVAVTVGETYDIGLTKGFVTEYTVRPLSMERK